MKTDVIDTNAANFEKTLFAPFTKMKFDMMLSRLLKFFAPGSNADLEIISLKHKLKKLEKQFHQIDHKKMELEKLLSDFHYRHTQELGDLLLEILKLRTQLFQADQTEYEKAKNDEEQFREQVMAERKRQKHTITKDEKAELKKKFRKATVLCHPDKVDEKYSAEANEIFISLKNAYDSNDLKKVSDILYNLEKGNYFKPKSQTVSEKEKLMVEIVKLRTRIKVMEKDIEEIRKSFEYKKISSISNWDEYFRNTKAKLETELAEMKAQLVAERR